MRCFIPTAVLFAVAISSATAQNTITLYQNTEIKVRSTNQYAGNTLTGYHIGAGVSYIVARSGPGSSFSFNFSATSAQLLNNDIVGGLPLPCYVVNTPQISNNSGPLECGASDKPGYYDIATVSLPSDPSPGTIRFNQIVQWYVCAVQSFTYGWIQGTIVGSGGRGVPAGSGIQNCTLIEALAFASTGAPSNSSATSTTSTTTMRSNATSSTFSTSSTTVARSNTTLTTSSTPRPALNTTSTASSTPRWQNTTSTVFSTTVSPVNSSSIGTRNIVSTTVAASTASSTLNSLDPVLVMSSAVTTMPSASMSASGSVTSPSLNSTDRSVPPFTIDRSTTVYPISTPKSDSGSPSGTFSIQPTITQGSTDRPSTTNNSIQTNPPSPTDRSGTNTTFVPTISQDPINPSPTNRSGTNTAVSTISQDPTNLSGTVNPVSTLPPSSMVTMVVPCCSPFTSSIVSSSAGPRTSNLVGTFTGTNPFSPIATYTGSANSRNISTMFGFILVVLAFLVSL